MKLSKLIILFFVFICFWTFFPSQESFLINRFSIHRPYSTPEKEIYILTAKFPFAYSISDNNGDVSVILNQKAVIDPSFNAEFNQKLPIPIQLINKKTSEILFSLHTYPYFYAHYSFQSKSLIIELMKHAKKRLYQKKIVIDPGHGAYSDDPELWDYYDCGVIGSTGVYESKINLAIAKMIREQLQDLGANVILTREIENDRNALRFEQRGKLVNDFMPDIYISVHLNSSENTKIRGTVVYYSNPTAKSLAQKIAGELTKRTTLPLYNLIDGKFEMIEAMKIQAKVLVECAFLSNPSDEKYVINPDNQRKIAESITEGIINFFEFQ